MNGNRILFILLGTIFVALGIFTLFQTNRNFKNCTEETTGIIVDFAVSETLLKSSSSINTDNICYPIIEYTVGDKKIIKQSSSGYGNAASSPNYKTGDKVKILYNPNNIENYIIKDDIAPIIISIVVIICGVSVIFVGILNKSLASNT